MRDQLIITFILISHEIFLSDSLGVTNPGHELPFTHHHSTTMGVLNADQYSAIWLRKSMAYKECEIVFDNSQVWAWSVESAVCVVSAMDDGKCSPMVNGNSNVVQESMWWASDLWWWVNGSSWLGFVTPRLSERKISWLININVIISWSLIIWDVT